MGVVLCAAGHVRAHVYIYNLGQRTHTPRTPAHPQVLCLTFCKITKAHLKRVLSDAEAHEGSGLRADVAPLIKVCILPVFFTCCFGVA